MRAEVLKNAQEAPLWTNCRLLLTTSPRCSLRITAFGPESMPADTFNRRLAFEESPGIVGLPASAELSPGGNGCLRINGLKAGHPGHVYVVGTSVQR